jgi:hypothetical protein
MDEIQVNMPYGYPPGQKCLIFQLLRLKIRAFFLQQDRNDHSGEQRAGRSQKSTDDGHRGDDETDDGDRLYLSPLRASLAGFSKTMSVMEMRLPSL